MAELQFDANQVAPNSGQPDPIPAGWYNAAIDESEMKPTKDGAGTYLQVRYSVLDGQYAGRKVYSRLNLRNSNPVAQEIAYGELSAICHATGIMQLQDSNQVHNIPVKIKVKLKPADGDYEASNEISSVKNVNEQVGMQANASPTQAPPQAPPQQPPQPPAAQPPVNPAAQGWQQPATEQPWQQPATAPAQQPVQQPVQQPQTTAAPPAGAGMPPWAQGQ